MYNNSFFVLDFEFVALENGQYLDLSLNRCSIVYQPPCNKWAPA